NPLPGDSAPKQPPAPIPEEPPAQKPEGENVQWIPGYWSWDADKNDFTWTSGTWRVPPPNRQWVPGRWEKTDAGWQWVPGFWAPSSQNEIPYTTPPPESLDTGPSMPAPDNNSFYIPGAWTYRDNGFLWRPGFWA